MNFHAEVLSLPAVHYIPMVYLFYNLEICILGPPSLISPTSHLLKLHFLKHLDNKLPAFALAVHAADARVKSPFEPSTPCGKLKKKVPNK